MPNPRTKHNHAQTHAHCCAAYCVDRGHFPQNLSSTTSHDLLTRSPPLCTTQKLLLWATLVFFKRGSQLQMSGAVLLTTIRLVLHAHFEPYKDAMDNLFDYLTLIIVALNGMCGVLLQVRSACVHRFHLDCV